MSGWRTNRGGFEDGLKGLGRKEEDEREGFRSTYSGFRHVQRKVERIVCNDPNESLRVVKEGAKSGSIVVGIVGHRGNREGIDYPLFGNPSNLKLQTLFCQRLWRSYLQGSLRGREGR